MDAKTKPRRPSVQPYLQYNDWHASCMSLRPVLANPGDDLLHLFAAVLEFSGWVVDVG